MKKIERRADQPGLMSHIRDAGQVMSYGKVNSEMLEIALKSLNKIKGSAEVTIYTGEFGMRSIDAMIRGDKKEIARLNVIALKSRSRRHARWLLYMYSDQKWKSLFIYLDKIYTRGHEALTWWVPNKDGDILVKYDKMRDTFIMTQTEPEWGYDMKTVRTQDPLTELKNWECPWKNEEVV